MRALPRLGLSLLAETQDRARRTWGLSEVDPFSGVQWTSGPGGSVMVHDASLWLDCSVRNEVEAGDHLIVLLTVHGLWVDSSASPPVRQGFRHRRPDAG